jgi:hypothetical protein
VIDEWNYKNISTDEIASGMSISQRKEAMQE